MKDKIDSTNPSDLNPNGVDCSMLKFPVKLFGINKFEEVNNLSINILAHSDDKGLYPVRVSKRHSSTPIDLFILINDLNDSHYVGIKDFETLVKYRE